MMADSIYAVSITSSRLALFSQRLLKWVRVAWLALALFLFVMFLIAIPGTYRMLQTPCAADGSNCSSWAQPTPAAIARIEQTGISLQVSAVYFVCLYIGQSLVFWAIGLLIFRHRSDQWFSLLVAHLMVLLGAAGPSMVFMSGLDFTSVAPVIGMVAGLLTIPLYQVLSLFFLTFPNGKFYGRWNAIPFILICVNTFFWIVPSSTLNIQNWLPSISSGWILVVFGSHLLVQVIRYRRIYTTGERQQTKWLIFGFSLPVVMLALATLIQINTTVTDGAIHPLVNGTMVVLCYLPVGISIGIAILRYRLWDIDVLINRTLVYVTLTAVVVTVYALIVGAVGSILESRNSFWVGLLGAGVIAVLFQPLRHLAQRAINRLMFGRRDEPISVMTEMDKGLEVVRSLDAGLGHLLETTATTLKLPYVAIERLDGAPVSFGSSPFTPVRFPLVYHAQVIGQLAVAPRSARESLNTADQVVLEHVARQASSVVYAARLTDELQESRQRIVTAREEERRRLRRDLHDGLGPALATLTLQTEAARDLIAVDPDKAEALLNEIIDETQNALAEIRRVAYALRPPALDDLGLVSALKEHAARCSSARLSIAVDAPETMPLLPAAVEVAVYRIAQEALTNVARHAEAQTCRVSLRVNGKMEIEIVDDGKGIPATRRAGVGLNSMHERAAELGGACVIESEPGHGTHILVSLPRQ